MTLNKVLIALICMVFLLSPLFMVRGSEVKTMTLSPQISGSIGASGGSGLIYFISGVKSIVFYTFNANDTLVNAKVESAVLRVKTEAVIDSTYISAYRWAGSWADETWDNFTLDRERAGENNLIGAKRVDAMDTWYSYTISPSDTILNALTVMPITIHLESGYLGSNLPTSCVKFQEAQLEITYTTVDPTPTPAAPELTPIILVVGLVAVSSVALIAKKKLKKSP